MKRVAQTLLPFKTEIMPKPLDATALAGLTLVLELMRAVFPKATYRTLRKALGYSSRKTVQRHLETLVLLVVAGGEHLDDVRILSADHGFVRLAGFDPTKPTQLKDFLYRFHQATDGRALAPEEDARLSHAGEATIRPEGPGLRALDDMLPLTLARSCTQRAPRATLDIDATILAAAKKTALRAYEGTRGYQPQMAFWAETGMWLADQFRDGNVPAEFGIKDFLQRVVACARRYADTLRLRGDSALYNEDALTWLADEAHVEFAVSADMSEALLAKCLALPEGAWQPYESLSGEPTEERQYAEVPDFVPGWRRTYKKHTQPLRYIAIRVRGRQRDILEGDDARWRHFAVVTNMQWQGDRLLRWHREKQGTVEHAHGVMKHDLGGGCLPCGRFGANAAWWRLNALAHNLLQLLKRRALPDDMQRMRPKTLRFRLFHMAGIVVKHARTMVLKLSETHPCARVFIEAREVLAAMAREAPA